ncbi:MAG: hypothetical protein WA941_01470, partial [Nitrososphaeraceae archaeon]
DLALNKTREFVMDGKAIGLPLTIQDEILMTKNVASWNNLRSDTRAFIGSVYGDTQYDMPTAVITQDEGHIERWKARMFILRLIKSGNFNMMS